MLKYSNVKLNAQTTIPKLMDIFIYIIYKIINLILFFLRFDVKYLHVRDTKLYNISICFKIVYCTRTFYLKRLLFTFHNSFFDILKCITFCHQILVGTTDLSLLFSNFTVIKYHTVIHG